MNRQLIALRLTLLVALAGVVPIAVIGMIGIGVLERRSVAEAQDSLHEVAVQAAGRIGSYLDHQKEILRALAAVISTPGAEQRLPELQLDVPSFAELTLFDATPPGNGQSRFSAELVKASLEGKESTSGVSLSAQSTPVIDRCVPVPGPVHRALCARIDVVELWRFVQGIKIGKGGYALAFNGEGRLIASGLGALRGAILTGEAVVESSYAQAARRDLTAAPTRYERPDGTHVLAGWAAVPERTWVIVAEQPTVEALAATRTAQWGLGAALLLALLVSLVVGVSQSQRVLGALAIEERWRTAGRIAAGITHDLGHRLRVLQQTAGLAELTDPEVLPQIRENLRSEVGTLQKFIADFSDLSRDVRAVERVPLELGAFLDSVRRTATVHAQAAGVTLEVSPPRTPIWALADRHLLERAALNLVSNAIEATARGGTVRLSVGGGERATLEVRDTGPGISAERQAKLFDAFVTTKKTGAHLGMGLANVKRITEALGGEVGLESQEGSGSTFRITLPRIAPPEPAVEAA